MAAPDFSPATIQILCFRSALICNNPNCSMLTVWPSDAAGPLALKVGEAAHIRDARKKTVRYDENMSDTQRADVDNGIWLCATCHTMIDKLGGNDFPVVLLRKWKADHEAIIKSLQLSRRSTLPFIRQILQVGQIAQLIVDEMNDKGSLFAHPIHEVDEYVIKSIKRIRTYLNNRAKQLAADEALKNYTMALALDCGAFMNQTGNFASLGFGGLEALRVKVGLYLKMLEADYGCTVQGPLRTIMPK